MSITSFSFPTPIRFGAGARKQVAAHLLEQGLKRPLIVTDRALGALPVLAEFRTHLDGLDVAVFAGVFGNPTCSQVMDGAAAYKAHNADCVIGFGGGAALDVAKVVGVAATHEGDILEYVWDHPQVRAISNPLPYFVALPTTSGTGSEVGRSSVVSENDTHLKRVVFSPKILARMVFADPELTLGLPPAVTAATGMDALTHNIESYLSPAYHPLCDGIALEGTRIAAAALRTAVTEPGNLQARSDMMMASMMGAIAFQKDLGRGAFGRACAGRGVRPAPRPGQRAHDRHGDGLELRGRAGEVRRTCPRVQGGWRRCGLRALAQGAQGQRRHHRHAGLAWRQARAYSAPGGDRRQGHLPPDQSAALHGGRLRALFQAAM
jgi:alcohol dehydrogenase YqhD (iron-dependent ADH family)